MPVTFFTTVIGIIVAFGSWALIGQRMKASSGGGIRQIRYLRNYLLNMGLFLIFVTVPQLALVINPARFPSWMAWGYIIGHIFSYIAIIQLLSLTLSLSPRLDKLSKPAVVIITVLAAITTVVNTITMGFGTQPQYDYQNHVALLNAAPVVGALIGIMALACMLPTVVMFFYNGATNPAARVRSFLIGGGLVLIMIAGPMHDIARTWQLYLAGDLLLIVAYAVLGTGILYRFEERIAPARTAAAQKSAA